MEINDYIGMNLKELTDKSNMIAKKYSAAYRGGAAQEVLNQIQEHLDMIRTVIWEVQYKESFKLQMDEDEKALDTNHDSIV
jgi:hypothetical protein